MQALLMLAAAISIGPSTIDFVADPADVSFEAYPSGELVVLPGGASPFQQGDPSLPGVGYSLVLPQGTSLLSVDVEVLGSVELPGTHLIHPVLPLPLCHPMPSVAPRSDAYSGGPFPADPVQGLHNGSKTGYRIGSFCFVPLRWNPTTGRLRLITEATLTPVVADDPQVSQITVTRNQAQVARRALERFVRNPGMLDEYAPPTRQNRGVPWVVIADQEHQETLQPLLDLRQSTHGAEFVSTQWIYANCQGRDTQEQIRNYLKDAYENHGLVYALIVGDYGETTRLSGLTIGSNTLNSTADLYYSDLDGDWDLDGDSKFGEIHDAVDYYSDIYTGRFSTDVPSRLQTIVEKTVAYETQSPGGEWMTTALLCGAGLWVDDPPGYWGSFVCDSIDTRIPSGWTVHKLYETYDAHPVNQIDLINQGVSYSSLNGHGNQYGVYWYNPPLMGMVTTSNYAELENTDMPVVFHSMACHPGHLEEPACIAERLMFWPDGGGIAVMFNSHWGIGTPPSFGPSEWLELYFAQVLLQDEEFELGVAHSVSKDEFYANVTISYQRWILQENNFLGDPALRFIAGQTGIEEGHEGPGDGRPALLAPRPNPASTSCAVGYAMPETAASRLMVYDISGRVVATAFSGELNQGSGSLELDVSQLPTGCYRVALLSSAGAASTPLVVLRR